MSEAQTTAKSTKTADERDAVWSPDLPAGPKVRPRLSIVPVLITLTTVALAVPLGWAMWDAYVGVPWIRDGTVRVYVVTMAPEVAGRIVKFPVADNQFVHKGDLLMASDRGKLEAVQGQFKEKWAKLTDDDLEKIAGRREQLEGKIEERYCKGKDAAHEEINNWLKTLH